MFLISRANRFSLRMTRALYALATVAALLSERPAAGQRGDPLEATETLLRRADFERAEATARDALTSGRLDTISVARVDVILGIIAAARNDRDSAEAFFRKGLVLDPRRELPPSAGPHVMESFVRARQSLAGQPPLSIRVGFGRATDPSHVLVDVQIEGNTEGLVQRLVVRGEAVYDVRFLQRPGGTFVEPLPVTPPCVSLVASALDEWGNELWPALARTTVCRPTPPGAAPPTPEVSTSSTPEGANGKRVGEGNSRAIPASVWIAAAATGGLAIATTVLGLVALDRRSDFDQANGDSQRSVDERTSLRNTALTAEHVATVAGVVTLGAATTTAALYFARPGRDEGARVGLRAGFLGAAVVVTGNF